MRDARIHIETDFVAERMVAEIKAMTPAALEHAREYLSRGQPQPKPQPQPLSLARRLL